MKKTKTQLERDAGKLISTIQKEWHEEAGLPEAEVSEEVMDKGHDLLKAAKNKNIPVLLNGMTITQFLGDLWVHKHPNVKQSIINLEKSLNELSNV